MGINIAIFASGSGSNAEQIIKHFENHAQIRVALVLTNNPKAMVRERAARLKVPCGVFIRDDFYNSDHVLKLLSSHHIDFIVLAGFLWLIPPDLIRKYPNKIVNIHPALLPKYGGKGMFGQKVHQAVLDSGDSETGITIHYVNENYDEGNIIFQKSCRVNKGDTSDLIQQNVQALEYKYFPMIIEKVISETFNKDD